MTDRRKHFKMDSFPPDVVEAVNKLFIAGHTHEQITTHLNELGYAITRSSTGRYGKNFLKKLEKVTVVKEQAKAILEAKDGSGLEMEEATVEIVLSMIMEFMLDLPDLKGAEATKVMTALARIQSSSVQREKLRIVLRDKVSAAAEEVSASAKSEGLSDAKADEIKKKILGIAA